MRVQPKGNVLIEAIKDQWQVIPVFCISYIIILGVLIK